MNDAGVDALEKHAQQEQGDTELPKVVEQNIQNDRAHLDPSRWWFAASAFPMAAATLGPVANAFSILALVRPWRQRIPPGSNITLAEYHDDPPWLLAINACQLAIAVVANVFLLLNMAKRIRFTIAQPVTIVGWYLSAICLIALDGTAAGPLELQPQIEYVWGQAFYYGMYAAVLYFITASLMVVTFVGAQAGKYDKDFQLTNAQRTLMLQTIMFLMYLLVGALVFSTIEGWAYLDAVYWADVTLFTVGFGDLYCETVLGRALLIPYALIGVISLGLVIGSIRSLALERGKSRLDARMIEKKRRRILRRMARKGKDEILVPIQGDGLMPHPKQTDTMLSEFDRRKEEFNIMRRIQHDVTRTRRWYAMALSTTIWLILWMVGAKIFQACERPYQDWSYFDGFYFCFVGLTTIGYGDVTPVSNGGKSFFVFWSLLALPTMTVLISNAGDTIVKAVRESTDFLGSVTILPGERGFRKDLKELGRTLSFGLLFRDSRQQPNGGDDEDDDDDAPSIREDPPGLLGAAQPVDESTDEEDTDPDDDDGDEPREKRPQDEQEAVSSGKSKADNNTERKPTDEKNFDSQASQSRHKRTIAFQNPPTPSPSSPTNNRPSSSSNNSSKTRSHDSNNNNNSHHHLRRAKTTSGSSTHSRSLSQSQSQSQSHSRRTRTRSRQFPSASASASASSPRLDLPDAAPADHASYLCVLVDEIARVTQHLKHQPPRKYSFPEWAWYLRLVGEDERRAETHRKARPHVHGRHCRHGGTEGDGDGDGDDREEGREEGGKGGKGAGAGLRRMLSRQSGTAGGETKAAELDEEENRMQWSWVGARSPLMGSQEEAEWILGKLTQRLQKELRRDAERAERIRDGDGNGDGGSGDTDDGEGSVRDAEGVSMEPPG